MALLPAIKAKAPGSLMILGEHAVLRGQKAIAASIDKYIHVELIQNDQNKINIDSNLGTLSIELKDIQGIKGITTNFDENHESCEYIKNDKNNKFKFVLGVINEFADKIISKSTSLSTSLFDLKITSEFSDTVGFASSSAVVVATIAVIYKWLHNIECDSDYLFETSKRIVRSVQGMGSGADCCACVYGGVVEYSMKDGLIKRLYENDTELPSLSIVYSGSKMPTPKVIEIVNQNENREPALFGSLFSSIGILVKNSLNDFINKDWDSLGKVFNKSQELMVQLGVSNKVLDLICDNLRALPSVRGAKISGSGLGDCVIAINDNKLSFNQIEEFTNKIGKSITNAHFIDVSLSTKGAYYV